MPRLDNCHQQFIHALQKEKWKIDSKPLYLKLRGYEFYIDVVARRLSSASEEIVLIIEVKCFPENRSQQEQLYTAIGQFEIYRDILEAYQLADKLYIAIPLHAYEGVFQAIGSKMIEKANIKLIVFDVEKEEIVQWLPPL